MLQTRIWILARISNTINSEWVDDWQELEIEREASPATTRNIDNTVVMTTDTAVKIADLAVEGSVVAVAADDDASYDYY